MGSLCGMRCMRIGSVCLCYRAYLRAFRSRNLPFGVLLKQKWLPGQAREPRRRQLNAIFLVRALRKQGHQDHQIRECEQPLIGADSSRFRSPRDEAQMAALRKIVYMLDANSRQAGDFRIGEDFLARLHGNHGPAPVLRPTLHYAHLDAVSIVCAAHIPEQ